MTSASVENIVDSAPAMPNTDNPATNFEADNLNNGPEVCDPLDNEEGSGLEEDIVDEPAPAQTSLNETNSIGGPDPSAAQEQKISYTSIVKVSKDSGPSASSHVSTNSLRWAPANTNEHKPSPAMPSPEPETSVPVVINGPESRNVQDEGHSIYVRNLTMNATVAQLEEEFKKFGPIRNSGIRVRSNKLQGFCFGFVEFESLESMQNALKAPSITIGNRQEVVEEKRMTTSLWQW